MKLLKDIDCTILKDKRVYKRPSSRGIILKDDKILLLYIKKHDDYSCPGGGLEKDETPREGLIREIKEETGANNIKIISDYGIYNEIIPPLKRKEVDYIYMSSYFFLCSADSNLGKPQLEDYEEEMGIKALWVNIYDAVAHNRKIQKEKPIYMSSYLERESFILELVAKELETKNV